MADIDSKPVRVCGKCGGVDRSARGDCKACAKAYREKWNKSEKGIVWSNSDAAKAAKLARAQYKPSKVKKKAWNAAWHAANKDVVSAAYYQNKEVVLKQHAEWRESSQVSIKAYGVRYRELNQKRVSAQNAAWRKSNPSALRLYRNNRRAKIAEVGGKLSPGLCERLFLMQKGKCACCSAPLGASYHMDHIMPLALGGSNTDNNIQLLTQRCNNQKHAKHPIDFMQSRGFLL